MRRCSIASNLYNHSQANDSIFAYINKTQRIYRDSTFLLPFWASSLEPITHNTCSLSGLTWKHNYFQNDCFCCWLFINCTQLVCFDIHFSMVMLLFRSFVKPHHLLRSVVLYSKSLHTHAVEVIIHFSRLKNKQTTDQNKLATFQNDFLFRYRLIYPA